jgi:pimeloyl-ACP methyl ester carboxylesterase
MFEAGGVRIYYEVHGSGEPLFLTHGSWGDATAWQGVIPRLANTFEVVVWDRRGHHRSADGEGPGSLREDAADLAALIEHIGRPGALVYGTSAGGIVTLDLVAARPDLVARAAVHEPPVIDMLEDSNDPDVRRTLDEQRRHLAEVGALIDAGRAREAAEHFIDNVGVGPGTWEILPEAVKDGFEANASTYGDELSEPGAWAVDAEALGAAGVPMMITVGTESPSLIRTATRELGRLVPSVLLKTLEGTGHVPYRTHPDMWIEATVSYFLE